MLECYLGGQAGGTALVDVLFGDVEPGGRLAESFPVSVAELPAHVNFATHPTQVQYRETLYVGYRFHDTFDVAPRFCFGHGLGYTTFTVGDLAVERDRHRPHGDRARCATPGSDPARRSSSSTCTTSPRRCTDPSRS